jgi:hypothetical protein
MPSFASIMEGEYPSKLVLSWYANRYFIYSFTRIVKQVNASAGSEGGMPPLVSTMERHRPSVESS